MFAITGSTIEQGSLETQLIASTEKLSNAVPEIDEPKIKHLLHKPSSPPYGSSSIFNSLTTSSDNDASWGSDLRTFEAVHSVSDELNLITSNTSAKRPTKFESGPSFKDTRHKHRTVMATHRGDSSSTAGSLDAKDRVHALRAMQISVAENSSNDSTLQPNSEESKKSNSSGRGTSSANSKLNLKKEIALETTIIPQIAKENQGFIMTVQSKTEQDGDHSTQQGSSERKQSDVLHQFFINEVMHAGFICVISCAGYQRVR